MNNLLGEHMELLEKELLLNYKAYLNPYANGLLSGLAGVILTQSVIFNKCKDDEIKNQLKETLELLIERISNDENCPSTYCDGLAGVGWLFCYLSEKKIIEIELDEFLVEVDEVLPLELERMLKKFDFDILHGSLGLGLYFLKRNRIDLVEKILKALETSACIYDFGIAWRQAEKYKTANTDEFNLGLAHGNISIIYFLYKCYLKGIMPDKTYRLMTMGIQFYDSNVQHWEYCGCYYPTGLSSINIPQKASYSRLSWCYGDLTILFIQLSIKKSFQDKAGSDIILSRLKLTAQRRDYEQTSVENSFFCHGACGIAYIFRKIYSCTNEQEFLEASKFWIQKAINISLENSSYPEYTSAEGKEELYFYPNLLTGIAGVYLSYLFSLQDGIDDSWDEALFLS